MPSANVNRQQNKKRLGRGLGSLLGADAGSFTGQDGQSDQASQSGQDHQGGQKVDSPKSAKDPSQVNPTHQQKKQGPSPSESHPVLQEKKSVEPVQSEKTESRPSLQEKQQNKTQGAVSVSKDNKDLSALSSESRIWSLAIEKVVPNPQQPRKDFSKEPLEDLARSIQAQGVLQPITVRKTDKGYEIIAGERRWRASQMAGLKEVPCIVKDVSDQKMMELALIENLQREDLNPLEEAMGFEQLIEDYELTQAQLAEKVGKSRVAITNSLRILALTEEAKQLVRDGALSLGHAKVLLSVQEVDLQKKLAKKCASRQWSVRTLEMEIKKHKDPLGSFQPDEKGQRLAGQLAGQLQKAIGTKVGIQYKKGKGRLEIHFYSDDELTGLYEKLKEALTPYQRN